MRKYLYCEAGFVEKKNWLPGCWVNVECPTDDDFKFLTETLKVPTAFLHRLYGKEELASRMLGKRRMPYR